MDHNLAARERFGDARASSEITTNPLHIWI
jgi:hypothetical protein